MIFVTAYRRNSDGMELSVRWSDENIYALIRKLRSDVIELYLHGSLIHDHFKLLIEEGNLEMIKTRLTQYRLSPIDLRYYGKIIDAIKETDTATFSNIDMNLIHDDIRSMINGSFSNKRDGRNADDGV